MSLEYTNSYWDQGYFVTSSKIEVWKFVLGLGHPRAVLERDAPLNLTGDSQQSPLSLCSEPPRQLVGDVLEELVHAGVRNLRENTFT